MTAGRAVRAGAVAALMALAACDALAPPADPPAATAAAPAEPVPPSALSRETAAYFAEIERDLRAQGLLRTDGGGPDTPFTRDMLVENFVRVALYDEYVTRGGQIVAQTAPSRLRRWEGPIRMRLVFGPSVAVDQQARDRAEVARYTARLSRLTGVPISLTDGTDANFDVLILNEDERLSYGPDLRRLVPGISGAAVNTIVNLPRSSYCLVFAFSNGLSPTYQRAVAIVRAEHPPLLRKSCFHEELAQAMGLANDSPTARPSIFNDDEEFGLLTTQDELMLRILYDRRLRPGMTAAEARPIVETIAAELLGGGT